MNLPAIKCESDFGYAILATASIATATPDWNLPAGSYAFVVAGYCDRWDVRSIVPISA